MEEREILLYQELVDSHRGTSRQVALYPESQQLRFDALLRVVNELVPELTQPNTAVGLQVADFGCGKGDFLPRLRQAGFSGLYAGLDGIQENLDDAKALGDPNAVFRLYRWDGQGDFVCPADVIVACGVFTTTQPNVRSRMIRSLAEAATSCFVMNIVRQNPGRGVWWDMDGVYPATVDEIVSVLDPAEWRFVVRADYLFNDFTVGFKRWPI